MHACMILYNFKTKTYLSNDFCKINKMISELIKKKITNPSNEHEYSEQIYKI